MLNCSHNGAGSGEHRLLGLFVGRDQVCRGHVHAGGQLPHVQVVDVGDPFHVGEGGDDS